MNHELIYQYIWSDKTEGGTLWKHLCQSTKKRRKRYNSKDSRGRLAAKHHITERPVEAEHRNLTWCLSDYIWARFFSAQIDFPSSNVSTGVLPQHIFP